MKPLLILFTLLISSIFSFAQIPTQKKDSVVSNKQNIRDSISPKSLGEIVVTSTNVKHEGNTDTYILTKKMIDNSHDTGELLGMLDGMHYNPLSTSLMYLGSSNVIILVDSVQKDQGYLKRLNPKRFSKVCVINQPTGKYAGYDAVINLVTKKTYKGYDGVVLSEINLRPSHTTANEVVSNLREVAEMTYTREKWNFAFSGSYLRANEHNGIWYEKNFPLNNYSECVAPVALKNPNREVISDRGNINLWSDYKISDYHSISFGVYVSPSYSKVMEDVNLISSYNNGMNVETVQKTVDKQPRLFTISPSIQYRGWIKKWSIGSVLQYSYNTFHRLRSVKRKDFSLEDNRHINAHYIWGGVDASTSLSKKLYLSISDYITWTKYKEIDYKTNKFLSSSHDVRNRFSASLQYSPNNNMSVGANAGIYLYNSSSDGITNTRVSPLIGANFMWSSSKVMLRLNYTATNGYPSLGQQQDYGRFIDSLIYQGGNPNLITVMNHRLNAMVNIMRFFIISGEYNHGQDAIYNIAESGYGIRPDGLEGYFVDKNFENCTSSSWRANITFNRTFNPCWTLSLTASVKGERASYREFAKNKTLPLYDWYVRYSNKSLDMQIYLSSSLHSELIVSPQSIGWERVDGYSLSIMKFLNHNKIQLVAMWRMPFHFIKRPFESLMESPAYTEKIGYDTYKRSDNQLTFTLVWRFSGGNKTRKYNRQTESVEIL